MRIINPKFQLNVAFIAIVIMTIATILLDSAVAQGVEVSNTATIDYQTGGVSVGLSAGPAIFAIEAVRTPSTLTFFRFAPAAPDAIPVQIQGSDYLTPAGFVPLQPPQTTAGVAINISSSISLIPTETFFSGEAIFVRVEDLGQNIDPTLIETVTAIVSSEPGDEITLQLHETGPNTGVFFAYVQSQSGNVDVTDDMLAVARSFGVDAIYEDPFDATEVSTDAAGVDPFGRVFDSNTGEFIDGAIVTIVDATTGQPADVYGIDGVSIYPSTVETGGTVTDGSGFVYNLEPGEFVFPIMFPGQYRFVVVPPENYTAPSSVPEDFLQTLDNAPFVIDSPSFGGAFELLGTSDVTFDIPLDPETDLVVLKQASVVTAAVGDFVRYSITVENRANLPVRNILRDILPRGFRYQENSTRLNGVRIQDPETNDGEELNFDIGNIASRETQTISYVVEITGGAREGAATNRAFVVNFADQLISNIGQSSIEIRDDFLRNQLTIIGRVAEQACTNEQSWPRGLRDGIGVPGIRLYLETGAYTVTDENGLFHFENVDAKTHVVQLDETTIPEGYHVVKCEENTRYAGSAISQFVDGQGGSVWRANFYLERNPGFVAVEEKEIESKIFNESTDYLNYNVDWLDQQPRDIAWAYPIVGSAPTLKSTNLGITHPNGLKVALFINGEKAKAYYFAGRDVSSDKKLAISRWRGIHLLDGDNSIKAVITDLIGNEVKILERTISFVTAVERAHFVEEASTLIANGASSPKIAVRITDNSGRPVHRGRVVEFNVNPPFRAKSQNLLEDELPLTAGSSGKATATVEQNGIAYVELSPTFEAGKVRISILLDEGKSEEISAILKPELREWIVVGLVEGSLEGVKQNDTNAGIPSGRDLLRDGRAAFFAKGTVGKDWLITAAADTDKRRGDIDDELFDAIDPDDRFPLYGDQSNQQFEAQSRYPVYLKVEKGGLRGVVGDYNSDLSDAKLGRYTRRFTGAQVTYEDEKFSFSGFAADTNQSFVKDELAADGTSGPYRLTTAPIVRNSEAIILETRDRFRPDTIVSTQAFVRYLDYDIDFDTGEIIFRLPIPATDENFNNNIIVADYEAVEAGDRNIIAGGRGAIRLLNNRAEIGATVIQENGIPGQQSGHTGLAGIDAVIDVTDNTKLRVEYAASRREDAAGTRSADALLAEVSHTSEKVDLTAYFNDTDSDFGLAQQNSATVGVRRYGLDARYKFGEFTGKDGTVRGTRFVEAKAYREENLETGATRLLTEASIGQTSNGTSGQLGLRRVVEDPVTGDVRRSVLLTSKASQNFANAGLTVRASREQPLGGKDAATQFPKRSSVGFDKQLFGSATLSATHEILDGVTQSSSNTRVGLSASPWTGGRVTASTDRITQDSSERIGATFGVDQEVRLTEKWSASLGVTRREDLKSNGQIDIADDIVPDRPISPQEINGAFTSLYTGLGYRGEKSTGSIRGELRKSDEGQRYTLVSGVAREVSDKFSYAGAARYTQENNDLSPDTRTADVRIGAAWRPRGDGLVAFNRFDLGVDEIDEETRSWKAVNNFALNAQISERLQVALSHGLKYSELQTNGDRFSGFTQLVGAEARFDITKRVDIGIHGSALISHNSGTIDYAFGPSIGVSPANNVWLSLGWNIEGFVDEDFEAAEYTRDGPFVKLRIKFDQHDARGLLNRISPAG